MKKKTATDYTLRLQEAGKDLYDSGWEKVTMQYSGSGDSSDYSEITLHHEDGDAVPVHDAAPALLPESFNKDKFLEDLWRLPPDGFENNEGGAGFITLDCKTGRITVSHDTYYTEASNETWEID
jgi:hypothetical protein